MSSNKYSVFPRLSLPDISARVGLYDPKGQTKNLLQASGLKTKAVESLSHIDKDLDILLIGAKAFEQDEKQTVVLVGETDSARVVLADFVNRGGRIVVFEQDTYPAWLFPVALSDRNATMTFPLRPSHPVLQGLVPGDLKFWRGDHIVAIRQPRRPISGSAAALVVSGSSRGIDNAPLLELPSGRGSMVFSQLQLISKAASEPVAGQIISNMLNYLDKFQPSERRTALVGGSKAYREKLRMLGLRFDDLSGKTAEADLTPYSLVICREKIESPQRLRDFVAKGGNVLIHRVKPASLDALGRLTNLNVLMEPYAGSVKRCEGSDPFFEAITREDVHWDAKLVGLSWNPRPREKNMSDGTLLFSKPMDKLQVKSHEIERWKRSSNSEYH